MGGWEGASAHFDLLVVRKARNKWSATMVQKGWMKCRDLRVNPAYVGCRQSERGAEAANERSRSNLAEEEERKRWRLRWKIRRDNNVRDSGRERSNWSLKRDPPNYCGECIRYMMQL